MDSLTTTEVREELALHDLTAEQINDLLGMTQEHGQVMITSPATMQPLTVIADDDAQCWAVIDSAREAGR